VLHAPLCVDRLARDRIVDIDHPDFARAEFIARSAARITAPPSTAAGNRAFCRLHRLNARSCASRGLHLVSSHEAHRRTATGRRIHMIVVLATFGRMPVPLPVAPNTRAARRCAANALARHDERLSSAASAAL
jgi:hypothetical protein